MLYLFPFVLYLFSMPDRQQTPIDRLIEHFDSALRTVFGTPIGSGRDDPADAEEQRELSAADKAESLCLMRVNHAGEVCAQALYQGQALTSPVWLIRIMPATCRASASLIF